MDFSKLFPSAANFIDTLPVKYPIIDQLQDVYAAFGALHLVGLALLGGCSLLLNLRFLGAGLSDQQPSAVERNLRPWLVAGVILILATGVTIGILNASKLFYSPAFFAKMMAMIASLVFAFGVTNSIAKNEGAITQPAKIAAVVATIFWLYSLYIFSFTQGVNPGAFHMITAAFALLLIFGRNRTRIIASIVVGALTLACVIYTYGIMGFNNDMLKFLEVTKVFVWIGAVVVTGFVLYEIFSAKSADASTPLARLIALFGILAWVTTAAGGRWIGFS